MATPHVLLETLYQNKIPPPHNSLTASKHWWNTFWNERYFICSILEATCKAPAYGTTIKKLLPRSWKQKDEFNSLIRLWTLRSFKDYKNMHVNPSIRKRRADSYWNVSKGLMTAPWLGRWTLSLNIGWHIFLSFSAPLFPQLCRALPIHHLLI